jgi:predicted ATP-grasp superfamily ATP-dependent carboligase
LGALLADVAHTRPVPVSGLATEPELADKLGLDVSTYEGPTGIIGVLQDRCSARGIEGLSLWAAVPHYVAAVPNPKAALALIRRLEGLSGIAIDGGELEENSERFEEQINEAINFNPEVGEMVARIEAEQATELDFSPDPPSGDEIANEFQRFLRQRNQDT